MRRFVYIISVYLLSFCSTLGAQDQSAVIMRIGQREVSLAEFAYGWRQGLYEAAPRSGTVFPSHKALKTYASRLSMFLLQAEAGRLAGLDTTVVYRCAVDSACRALACTCLTDSGILRNEALRRYKLLQQRKHPGSVQVMQIYRYLPQNITATALRREQTLMDSLYRVASQNPQAFGRLVAACSDAKSSDWVNYLQMPIEFEEQVFAMKPGEISAPFFTPQGLHIVQVLQQKPLPDFEQLCPALMRQVAGATGGPVAAERIAAMKDSWGYEEQRAAISELKRQGSTRKILFTLGGRAYTGEQFALFASAHPMQWKRQWEAFVTKSVLDCMQSRLPQTHDTFRWRIQALQDSLLQDLVMHRHVQMPTDEEMQRYFYDHQRQYHWESPRFAGIVIHGSNKRQVRKLRKFLKKLPSTEWNNAIRLTVNAQDSAAVLCKQAVFRAGDDAFVDEEIFKGKKATPLETHPYTVIIGQKVKGPASPDEVGKRLLTDCLNHKSQRWLDSLRQQIKVEIDQEVLKTVNNQ